LLQPCSFHRSLPVLRTWYGSFIKSVERLCP
jgi:hypothetical protein